MDAIPWPQAGIGAGWALVAFFVWLIFTGKLRPRADIDDANHRADQWLTESRIKDQQIREQEIQLGHMAEVGKTVDAIMRAMPHTAAPKGGE